MGANSYCCRNYRGKTGRGYFCPPPPPTPHDIFRYFFYYYASKVYDNYPQGKLPSTLKLTLTLTLTLNLTWGAIFLWGNCPDTCFFDFKNKNCCYLCRFYHEYTFELIDWLIWFIHQFWLVYLNKHQLVEIIIKI